MTLRVKLTCAVLLWAAEQSDVLHAFIKTLALAKVFYQDAHTMEFLECTIWEQVRRCKTWLHTSFSMLTGGYYCLGFGTSEP